MGFLSSIGKGVGAVVKAGFLSSGSKFSKPSSQKMKSGKVADNFLDKSGRASVGDFTHRFKNDKCGEFYGITNFGKEKREKVIKEITGGLRKTPGALKYGNLHSEDFEKGLKQFGLGKYGAYKDLFVPGKEKERQELKKSLEALSKTVPHDASDNKFSRN